MNKINKVDKVFYRLYLDFRELYRGFRRLYIALENTFRLNYYREGFLFSSRLALEVLETYNTSSRLLRVSGLII